MLSRAGGQRTPTTRRVGALVIDTLTRRATYAGQALELSPLEFALLDQLGTQPARVHTKDELLREVWGYEVAGRTRTVDAHACRLRGKLCQAGAEQLVINHRGVGYALTAPAAGEAAP